MSRNRFLLDQMLDADVAVAMVEAGYDAIRVSEIGLARAEDDAILARAIESSGVLITLDEHFGDWAVLPLKKHPGVIRIKANPATTDIFCPYSCRFSLHTATDSSLTCWSLSPVVGFGMSRQTRSDRGATTRSHDGLALSASAARSARNTNFRSYTVYMRGVLEGWRPGMRLFVYPCPVLYQPDRACEIAFDAEEVRAVLADYPGWQRDHATLVAGSS